MKRSRLRIVFAISLAACVHFPTPTARAQQFSDGIHEGIPAPQLRRPASFANTADESLTETELNITAFGQQFELVLKSNSRILTGLPAKQLSRFSNIDVYRGRVKGLPESWARITRSEHALYGIMWDGVELYAFEPHADKDAHALADDAGSDYAVYRLSDTPVTYRDVVFYPTKRTAPLVNSAADEAPEQAKLALPTQPPKRMTIGVIGDSEFAASNPQDPEGWLMSVVNTIDGIFLWQVGVQIQVGELRILGPDSDPFDETDPGNLLGQVENYRATSDTLRTHGLTHLFTGKSLDRNDADQLTLGVANVGTVCDARFGAGLTQTSQGQLEAALIASHEIGHNFGAPHDGEAGSTCANAPQQLMAASLSLSREFSQCSIEQMLPEIQSATCMTTIPPNDVSVTLVSAPASVDVGEVFTLEFDVEASGSDFAYALELEIDLGDAQLFSLEAAGWDCNSDQNTRTCRRRFLEPNTASRFILSLANSLEQPLTVSAALASAADPDAANNSLSVDIGVTRHTEVRVTLNSEHVRIRPHEETEIQAIIENPGDAAADEIIVELVLPTIDLVELAPDSGECEPVTEFGLTSCNIGMLPAGEKRSVRIRMRANELSPRSEDLSVFDLHVFSAEASAFIDSTLDSHDLVIGLMHVSERFVDLAARSFGPAETSPGQSVEIRLSLTNQGPDAATSVQFSFTQFNGDFISTSLTDGVSCSTRDRAPYRVVCTTTSLAPGESVDVSTTGTFTENGFYQLSTSSSFREFDIDSPNNGAIHFVRVSDPPPAPEPEREPEPESEPEPEPNPGPPPTGGVQNNGVNGSSGGGGLSVIELLLLALAAAFVLRYRASLRTSSATLAHTSIGTFTYAQLPIYYRRRSHHARRMRERHLH